MKESTQGLLPVSGLGCSDQVCHALLCSDFVVFDLTQHSVDLCEIARVGLQLLIFGACESCMTVADLRCLFLFLTRERFLVAACLGHLATLIRGQVSIAIIGGLYGIVLMMAMERVLGCPCVRHYARVSSAVGRFLS